MLLRNIITKLTPHYTITKKNAHMITLIQHGHTIVIIIILVCIYIYHITYQNGIHTIIQQCYNIYIYIICYYIYIICYYIYILYIYILIVLKKQIWALDHGTPMGCEGKGGPAAGIPNLHGTGKNGGFWSVIQLFNFKKWMILPKKKGDFLKLVDGSYHVHSIMIPWFTVVHRNFPQESQLVIFQGKLTTGKNCDLHKLVTFSKFWKKCDFPNGKKKNTSVEVASHVH